MRKLSSPRRRSRWLPLALLASLGLSAVPAALDRPAEAMAGRPDGPLVPAEGFYVGAYTKHSEGYGEDRQKESINDLEARLGRRLHIDHHFYDWDKFSAFPTWREPFDVENGRIPMISWNGTDTTQIAAGAFDGYILDRARAVKEFGAPMFLRWFWEMDGNKKADRARSPKDFIAAWRRIHDIFVAQGATNAVWVWCPNAYAFNQGKALQWYPGPNYVDWICSDGYNFAPNRPGDAWRSFDEIFEGFYKAGKALNKPMMIGEFGVLEDAPGRKEAWFHEAHDHLQTKFPAIAALVYFNADSTTDSVYYDFRVDSSPEAFNGFHYLFTGPAPVPRPLAPPTTPPPTPVTTASPTPVTTKPRPVTPKPVTPKPVTPTPAVTPPSPVETPVVAVAPAPKQPSPRLTWVLEVLHHLGSTDSGSGA